MGDFDKFKNSPAAERLTDILAHIIKERPVDGLQLFESLAHFARDGKLVPDVKASPYLTDQPKPRSQLKDGCFDDVQWAEAFADVVAPLKAKPKAKAEGEEEGDGGDEGEGDGEDDVDKLADKLLYDVVLEQEIFNSLGVGLREHEAYRVYVWLKKLLEKNTENTKETDALKSARFWGKIVCNAAPPGGKPRDYYIAECEIDPDAAEPEAEEGEEAAADEEGGKGPETILKTLNEPYKAKNAPEVKKEEPKQRGVNYYKYYVTTSDDLTTWRKLEDVKPGHIQAARKIKKLFTGDLDAPVNCHPPFPDRAEQYYLRAQIARITHGCKVAPRGIYAEPDPPEVEEDAPPPNWAFPPEGDWQVPAPPADPPMEQPTPADPSAITGALAEADEKERESALNELWGDAEQKPTPAVYRMWGEGYLHDKLMEIENWVHIEPPILKSQGRATEFKAEEGGDEDAGDAGEEAEEPPPEKKEPVNPLMSILARDNALTFPSHSKPQCPAWVVRKAYTQPTDAATRTYLVKSMRWPGAVCFANVRNNWPGAESWNNLYIGDGLKGGDVSIYAPPVPGMGATEFPTPGDVLQVDCTPDDEAVFQPPPDLPPEVEGGDEDEEGEGEGDE